jgi:hypothetical protein
MRTVRDESGRRYLLLKRSGDAWLVRDPETGEESYRDGDALSPADDEPPLAAAARAVPADVRTLLSAVPDERALGLLVELDERGPLPVRTLLGAYELCESDLHGLLAELRAAGLVVERSVAGERGYGLAEAGADAVASVRRDP